MACKLTYKGLRFDSKQQLINHLRSEGVLSELLQRDLEDGRTQINTQTEIMDNRMSSFIISNSVGLNITVSNDSLKSIKKEIDFCGLS